MLNARFTRWLDLKFSQKKMRERAIRVVNSITSSRLGFAILKRLFQRFIWYYLILSIVQRRRGDHHGAFQTLMAGQMRVVGNPILHRLFSELYRDDGTVFAAHTHLKISELLKPGYSTIRRLTFESDHGLHEDGTETMRRLLTGSSGLVQRHIVMVNRVSIFYPEHRKSMAAVRNKWKERLRNNSFSDSDSFSSAVASAIANRWLTLALALREKGFSQKLSLNSTTSALLTRLEADLGRHALLLDLAWDNENTDTPTALYNGAPVPLSEAPAMPDNTVELFIPTPFFANPDEEKPTYQTIRQTFVHMIDYLMSRPDLVIVPRHQLYWRQRMPLAPNARIVSYHTQGPLNARHLHIQESPLAGRCSFDHAGFAGYASIATEHGVINDATGDLSAQQLGDHQEEMVERYVRGNVSKYHQSADNQPITGRYVFVALQIPVDIVAQLAHMTGVDLLQSVADYYRGSGIRVVVKRHPYCGSMGVQKCLDKLEAAGDIVRTTNSIHSVIAGAELVFTVNSGVGLEALMHGRAVIVSGGCDYSYAVTTAHNPDELRRILDAGVSPDPQRIQKLLYYYTHWFTVGADAPRDIQARLDAWLDNRQD